MGMSFRIGVWNVMWARPGTERGEVVRRRLAEGGFDVICLTEAATGGNRPADRGGHRLKPEGSWAQGALFPDGGHVIESDADYGYRLIDGRRKVLLWSRKPWREVDQQGHPGMPGGRFVSGLTETPTGEVRFVGVCIPWEWAHVNTGRKDRARWEDHLKYLEGLERYLLKLRGNGRVVVAGDFNQSIPKTRARGDVYEALIRVLRGWAVATGGGGGIDHVVLSEGLRALLVERWKVLYRAGKKVSDHDGLTVEVG